MRKTQQHSYIWLNHRTLLKSELLMPRNSNVMILWKKKKVLSKKIGAVDRREDEVKEGQQGERCGFR